MYITMYSKFIYNKQTSKQTSKHAQNTNRTHHRIGWECMQSDSPHSVIAILKYNITALNIHLQQTDFF